MSSSHILVVDDDLFIVETLRGYLETQGYRVTAASGCGEALATLRGTDKVDLVILDYLMGDGSATDLLRTLGEEKCAQRPPIIMASSFLDPTTPIWLRLQKRLPVESQSLIHAYLTKPYALDAMKMALHEVLGGDYIPGTRSTRPSQKIR